MNKLFILLSLLLIIGCSSTDENKVVKSTNEKSPFEEKLINDSLKKAKNSLLMPKIYEKKINNNRKVDTSNEIDKEILSFKKEQLTLRQKLLSQKMSNALKESFLQELYIRNAVRESNDSLEFFISFNLHSADCGASDCYSNDLSFNIPFNKKVEFPNSFSFKEREHGCTVDDKTIEGIYNLQENSNDYFIFHNQLYKRTLVIYKKQEWMSDLIILIPNTEPNMVTSRNLLRLIAYDNEKDNPNYPFRSRDLSYPEYEKFLE